MSRGKKKATGFKRITAKYDGKCSKCAQGFKNGWVVYWHADSKAIVHTKCSSEEKRTEARLNGQRKFAINNTYGGMTK